MPPKERGVYTRPRSPYVWISYAGPDGKTVRESTEQTDRRVARNIRNQRVLQVADGTWRPKGKQTSVEEYAERWIAIQEARGLATACDLANHLRRHVVPELGRMPLEQVKTKHVLSLIEKLKSKIPAGELAPRTVLHVYRTLTAVCKRAVRDGEILASPCLLEAHELPADVDKDPKFRPQALYTKDEVELLISDERVAWDRRVFYALEFFTGSRFGEIAGRRWFTYESDMEPLGRIVIDTQYDDRPLKSPRGNPVTRIVPVHPVLAKLLAEWRLSGWPLYFGRPPHPDDFIVPTRYTNGRNGMFSFGASPAGRAFDYRLQPSMWRCFEADLAKLGLRHRRQHDTRRTFISLLRSHGAPRDLVHAMSHGAKGDVFDQYTSFEWPALCKALLCYPVRLRGKATVANLPARATAHSTAHSSQNTPKVKRK